MTDPSAEMERRIESDDIDHVFVEFADVNGIARSKQLTADYFLDAWEDGITMNLLLLVQTPRNDVPEGSGYGAEVDYADGRLLAAPSTYQQLPWRDDAARVLADFHYQGQAVGGAPRVALQRVLGRLDDAVPELDFYAGSELEFYLLQDGETDYEPATSHKHECVSWATEAVAPFYDKLAEWAPEYGIDLHSLQHEHGAGQLEVLFEYGSVLEQADTTFDFRRLVKQTALLTDYQATFMAKPYGDREGSGYHLHVSAFDDDGENAFAPEGDEGLSERGRHFVGGLLEHADALAGLCTPNPNAFKRYDPDGFAPYAAAWGLDNRMTALRVPNGVPRIENRIPSADANPYIVMAATLAAGLDGLQRELDPGEPWTGNPAGDAPTLPQSMPEALSALQADDVLTDHLGDELVRAYTATKREELAAYRRTVTPWEREQYVETL
jgi:glutamine synthetase